MKSTDAGINIEYRTRNDEGRSIFFLHPSKVLVRYSIFLLLFTFTGCGGGDDIQGTYGKRRGVFGGESVNGTAVLAGMFEQKGCSVFTWERLSPKLEDCDVIVWAPNDFRPPKKKQREFLEGWLANKSNRTLVYIGRDYDSEMTYWKKMEKRAPLDQRAELTRRLARAQVDHDRRRTQMPKEEFARWFVARGNAPRQAIEKLEGEWSEGIDVSKIDLVVEGRFDVPQQSDEDKLRASAVTLSGDDEMDADIVATDEDWDLLPDYEPLLSSEDAVLVNRLTDYDWNDNQQILVVTNGSFLLNLPLVNHEHRKLAGKLIDECNTPGVVAFVEGGSDIAVLDKEPDTSYPTGLEALIFWPIAPIALHFIALGIVACFCLFPTFGRPREGESESTSDFGKHIDALGKLMEQTNETAYAANRMRYYHEHVRKDS